MCDVENIRGDGYYKDLTAAYAFCWRWNYGDDGESYHVLTLEE